MGVQLDRLALIPRPGDQWPVITAALVDGFDLVLLRPPGRVGSVDARRLVARIRERGTVLALLGGGWPESTDIHLAVAGSTWTGLGAGHGHLQARRMEVVLTGRRAAARPRRVSFWMPAGVEGTGPVPVEGAGPVHPADEALAG